MRISDWIKSVSESITYLATSHSLSVRASVAIFALEFGQIYYPA